MKTMFPPGYHHNAFGSTHALGHKMYGYTLLVLMNQRVLNKLSKEHNLSDSLGQLLFKILFFSNVICDWNKLDINICDSTSFLSF